MSTTYESFHTFETANGYAYYNDRNITEEFDETKDYVAGDLVFHTPYATDGYLTLYQFNVDHPAGVWNRNHVKNIQLDQLLKTNKSSLNLKDRKIIVVGDSYANLKRTGNWLEPFAEQLGVTFPNGSAYNTSTGKTTYYTDNFLHIAKGLNGFIAGKTSEQIKKAIGKVQIFALTQGGYGFIGNGQQSGSDWYTYCNTNWKKLTDNNYIDSDTITDIIILGGYNDIYSTNSAIREAIRYFNNNWIKQFKNATVYLGFIGNTDQNNFRNIFAQIRDTYQKAVYELMPKWLFIENIEGLIHRYDFFNYKGNPKAVVERDGSDGHHPVGDYGTQLAYLVVHKLKGINNNIPQIGSVIDTVEDYSDFNANGGYSSYVDNLHATLIFRDGISFVKIRHKFDEDNNKENVVLGKLKASSYYFPSQDFRNSSVLCIIKYK